MNQPVNDPADRPIGGRTGETAGEEEIARLINLAEGDDPSDDFVDRLRSTVAGDATPVPPSEWDHDGVVLIGFDRTDTATMAPPSPIRSLALAVAALAVVAVGVGWLMAGAEPSITRVGESSPVDTTRATSSTEPAPLTAVEVGEAWFEALVTGDRAGFEALHADDVEPRATVMLWGFGGDSFPAPERRRNLYFDAFDAWQEAVPVPADEHVELQECRPTGYSDQIVKCRYRMDGVLPTIGIDVVAEIKVDDGTIVGVTVTSTPDDRHYWGPILLFLNAQGTDQDRECMRIGFASRDCGRHQSDLIRRYQLFDR